MTDDRFPGVLADIPDHEWRVQWWTALGYRPGLLRRCMRCGQWKICKGFERDRRVRDNLSKVCMRCKMDDLEAMEIHTKPPINPTDTPPWL